MGTPPIPPTPHLTRRSVPGLRQDIFVKSYDLPIGQPFARDPRIARCGGLAVSSWWGLLGSGQEVHHGGRR